MIPRTLGIARVELLILRRNLWLFMATLIMVLFALALTFAGSAPTGSLGVDMPDSLGRVDDHFVCLSGTASGADDVL